MSKLSRTDALKLTNLVKHLERFPESVWFKQPVDWKKLGLNDYPEIIKNPMDLSTVKKSLTKDQYADSSEVIYDINLIWENCRTYNSPDTEVVSAANFLQTKQKEYCEQNSIEMNLPLKRRRDPKPLELKKELSNLIKKVSHDTLAHIVTVVESECSTAAVQLENDKLLIKLDEVENEVFEKLQEIIQQDTTKKEL